MQTFREFVEAMNESFSYLDIVKQSLPIIKKKNVYYPVLKGSKFFGVMQLQNGKYLVAQFSKIIPNHGLQIFVTEVSEKIDTFKVSHKFDITKDDIHNAIKTVNTSPYTIHLVNRMFTYEKDKMVAAYGKENSDTIRDSVLEVLLKNEKIHTIKQQ